MAGCVAVAAPVALAPSAPAESTADDEAGYRYELVAVSADSAGSAWAVGTRMVADGRHRSLIERWDGSGWRTVESPDPGGIYDTFMTDVEATSPSDAWAVGYYWSELRSGAHGLATLAVHWDGSEWVQQTTSSPSRRALLSSVSAVSADDVWAVGSYTTGLEDGVTKTLAQHWDGSSWSRVRTPNPLGGDGDETSNYLTSVTAIAADDVWAVGATGGGKTLFEHWNGKRWTVVTRDKSVRRGSLRSVDAVSANDIWAVGSLDKKTLTLHWDGDAWAVVGSPNADGDTNQLNGVSAVSSSDVWVVGRSGGYPIGDGEGATLVEHWDGKRWRIVDSPNGHPYDNSLADVSAGSDDDVWAVGLSWSDWDDWYETRLHWDGSDWTG